MSYWDWLPLEMQVYVLRLRDGQALIDRRESPASRDLCVEIKQYGELRERWGLGFVHPCRCKIVGNGRHKMEFWGWYRDQSNVKRGQFLGDNLEQALGRVDHIKSLL